MNLLPPLPPLDGLHPLVVHFPIALLVIVPILLVIAMLARDRVGWARSAALMLVLGSLGAFAAAWSGEAAEGAAERVAAASATLERHEEGAEVVRGVFGLLALAYVGFLALARGVEFGRGVWRAAHVVVIAGALIGLVLLARVAHEGGRLVHEFGVHAPLAASKDTTPRDAPPLRAVRTMDDD